MEKIDSLCQMCSKNEIYKFLPLGNGEVTGVCEKCLNSLMSPKPLKRKHRKIGRNDKCPWCLQEGELVKWKKCAKHNP